MIAHPGNGFRSSIVVPIFNEEPVLSVLRRRTRALMSKHPGAAVTINDGTPDCISIIRTVRRSRLWMPICRICRNERQIRPEHPTSQIREGLTCG